MIFPWKFSYFHWLDIFYYHCWMCFFEWSPKDEGFSMKVAKKKSDASFFQGRKSLPHCNSCRPTAPNISLKSHHVINSSLYPTLPKLPPINRALSTTMNISWRGLKSLECLHCFLQRFQFLHFFCEHLTWQLQSRRINWGSIFKSSIRSADHRLFWFNLISWWSSWYLKTLFIFLWHGLPAFFVLDKVLEVFSRVFFGGRCFQV